MDETERTLEALKALPAPQSCRLIDFDAAEVRPGIVNGTWILIVKGTVPCSTMSVELVPLVYIRRPEFWEVEVVGCLRGPVCLATTKTFTEVLPLDGTIGTEGIDVVGATRRKRIDVP
jgi:hypothetical protein